MFSFLAKKAPPAPGIITAHINSQPITVDAATNGPTMLVFLAHWCPHCNAEVPRLNAWKNSGAVPPELNVVGVSTAVSEGSANYPPSSWLSNLGWTWPVMADEAQGNGEDGKAALAYGATGWATSWHARACRRRMCASKSNCRGSSHSVP